MRIKNQKDFWAGILFIGFGLFFAGLGTQYTMGTAARVGPGYFPTALGVIVILLGIVVSVSGLSAKAPAEKVDDFHFPTLLLILGSIALFGLLLKPLGLMISLFILIAVSSYASHEFSWKAMLINAAVLIGLCLAVFVWGLKLELKLWPSLIGY
ncbi:MAG: tripartite tricarboxylate transporter TctB family protein [Thermodesulfobacteriota bacterium]